MNPARPSPPRRASPLNHEPKSPFPPMLLLVRCLATVAREVTLKAAWPLWAPCSYVPSGLCVMVYSLCADFIANSPISLKSALLWIWWSACLHSPLLVLLASCPVPSQTLSTQVIQTWLKGFNNLKKNIYFNFFILSIKHSRVQTHVLKHLHFDLQQGLTLCPRLAWNSLFAWTALELKTIQCQHSECESYRHKPLHLAYLRVFDLTVFRPQARLLCSQTCVICIIIAWPYPISASPPEPQRVGTTILHPLLLMLKQRSMAVNEVKVKTFCPLSGYLKSNQRACTKAWR